MYIDSLSLAWHTKNAFAHREDRATLESDLSADTSAISWAETARICPFCFCPAFWLESDKLNLRTGLICAIGKDLLNGIAVKMLAIGTPGMIRGGRQWDLKNMVEVFGIHSLSLMRELFEDGVRK